MSSLPERVENKFYVAPNKMNPALALVRRTCRWDRQYPEEQINSLYFDTPELDQYESSLAGEFAKSKVRIRWYGSEHDPHAPLDGPPARRSEGGEVPVWLELKERRGFASTKQRRPIQVSAAVLKRGALAEGIVPNTTLMQAMAEFGFFTSERLCPVVAISYWRRRFVEPQTGFKVAFDADIRSSMVMTGIGRGERGLRLAGAVVEVKGASAELPISLHRLADLGSSWTRFSKFAGSIDAHAADLSSVSRSWPSGVLHAEACTGVSNNG